LWEQLLHYSYSAELHRAKRNTRQGTEGDNASANSAAGTIDPHLNYTLQYWQIYQAPYDGLIA
jgi:hypothetical protein